MHEDSRMSRMAEASTMLRTMNRLIALSLGIAFNIVDPIFWIHFWILVFGFRSGFWIPKSSVRPLWDTAGYDKHAVT